MNTYRNMLGLVVASVLTLSAVGVQAQTYIVGVNGPGPFSGLNAGSRLATAPNGQGDWELSWQNAVEGYGVDVMNAIAADAGFEVVYSAPRAFSDLIPALLDGEIDIIGGQTTITDERREMGLLFSDVYARWTDAIIVLAADTTPYTSLADFAGEVVCCAGDGNLYRQHVARLQEEEGIFAEAVPGLGNRDAIAAALRDGTIKVEYASSLGWWYDQRRGLFSDLRIVETYEPVIISEGGIAVRQEDTVLMEQINASLQKLKADGTVAALAAKWGITPP